MNQELKENWIKDQIKQITLVTPGIIPHIPYIGLYFKVNNLKISEKIFKE
jgi:hypothetical protein